MDKLVVKVERATVVPEDAKFVGEFTAEEIRPTSLVGGKRVETSTLGKIGNKEHKMPHSNHLWYRQGSVSVKEEVCDEPGVHPRNVCVQCRQLAGRNGDGVWQTDEV